MRKVIHLATTTALIVFLAAHGVAAQTSSEIWKSFAEHLDVGTELNVTQEGVPDAIPAEACYLGWQESLTQLAMLAEPEIPG